MFVCKARNPLPVAARARHTDSVTLSRILAPFPCLFLASGVTYFRDPKQKHWLCCGFKTKQRAGLARVLQMPQGRRAGTPAACQLHSTMSASWSPGTGSLVGAMTWHIKSQNRKLMQGVARLCVQWKR